MHCCTAISALRLRIATLVLVLSPCVALYVSAQTTPATIQFDSTSGVFRIDAADSTYVFGINEVQGLQNLYWGRHLAASDRFAAAHSMPEASSFDPSVTVTPQEYVGWGGGLYVDPDLKITFPDGNRDLVLKYVSHRIDGDSLSIVMKDISRDVYVMLNYQADGETGILRRSATVENRTGAPFTVEQIAAGTWSLPRGTDYRLRYLTGRWAGEWNVQERHIEPGKTVLESRRGTTGAQNNPWFAIDRKGAGDQDEGEVWFGALGWSGSWQISVEQDQLQQVRVTGGPNAFDFGYLLKPREKLTTPDFYGGYSDHGIGGASRLMHRYEIDSILPRHPKLKLRPVLYNSWEATGFDVNEAGQMALAEKAASIGVERFVMDDGWFGERKNDHSGLGDWYVNQQKFPHGLNPLIDKVHSLGMDFGLWVEPEMVNPNSDLYRNHPDWVLNFPDRPRTEGRNQLVLNLARPDVRAYIYSFLDKLLTQNDIAFLKWDYNRNWSEPGWPAVTPDTEKNVYVDFTNNYYSILAELRQKHPKVEIESCSGGGSRVDLGIMRYTDEVWPSDNTDAYDRLLIQNGFTYAYSPGVMMAWVTDSPTWVNSRSLSLEYRFLSSMQGSLGIGANLNKWTREDLDEARKMVAVYKSIRETVQRGSLYRLITPENNSEQSVTETVSRDGKQAVTFAFLHSSRELYPFPLLQLRGLEENATYTLSMIAGDVGDGTPTTASGSYWMNHGLDLKLRGDFQALAFTLTRTK
ncbi:alpha-galactosidase [Tunturibacter empetritectus]|uniref:Alpha-galactosidase n=1 Tax=Tunturiibacter empetritectus TaxID=3069691 RepID=A0A7W8IJV0_9BACT|nr:alpha-galactosidase [Edaphobacter lichenicola]MBB5318423.1 alpha-galactosidase [Edaphobacter lichenicola]